MATRFDELFGNADTTTITIRVPTESLKWYKEAMADYKLEMEYELALHVITVGTNYKCAQQSKKLKEWPPDICPTFIV